MQCKEKRENRKIGKGIEENQEKELSKLIKKERKWKNRK